MVNKRLLLQIVTRTAVPRPALIRLLKEYGPEYRESLHRFHPDNLAVTLEYLKKHNQEDVIENALWWNAGRGSYRLIYDLLILADKQLYGIDLRLAQNPDPYVRQLAPPDYCPTEIRQHFSHWNQLMVDQIARDPTSRLSYLVLDIIRYVLFLYL